MKHDLTTGTWQDDTGCPISIIWLLLLMRVPKMIKKGTQAIMVQK